jgi:hypothetical protein
MASRYPAAVSLAYHAIMRSDVFVLNGPPIDLPRALYLLGRALHERELPEHIWGSLGEFSDACLGDLVVGAYWSCSEWYNGQASDTYAAFCSLGQVFSPGMTSCPEPDASEFTAYELIGKWFSMRYSKS